MLSRAVVSVFFEEHRPPKMPIHGLYAGVTRDSCLPCKQYCRAASHAAACRVPVALLVPSRVNVPLAERRTAERRDFIETLRSYRKTTGRSQGKEEIPIIILWERKDGPYIETGPWSSPAFVDLWRCLRGLSLWVPGSLDCFKILEMAPCDTPVMATISNWMRPSWENLTAILQMQCDVPCHGLVFA